MALFKNAFKGPGLLVGLGVVIAAPLVIPAVGRAARPLAKVVIRGYLAAAGLVSELASEAHEHAKDLIAEVEGEREAATKAEEPAAKAEEPAAKAEPKPRARKPQTKTT